MTDMKAPSGVSAHGPHRAWIARRPSRPSRVARSTYADVEPLSEWFRLRTIVDALLPRVSAAQDGTMRPVRPIVTNEEHLDG
jgi:hypothetical protein